MNNPCAAIVRAGSSAVVALLGPGAVTRASAATFDWPTFEWPLDVTFSPRDYVMAGLALVLLVMLAVSVAKRSAKEQPPRDGPDMRWWRNYET